MGGMSRELTIAWVKRNCPDPRVLKDVIGRLDQAAASGFLLLVFGNRLTKSRSPYLVVSHYSEMFAFELTSRQLKNMGVPPDVLGAVIRKWPREEAATANDPVIALTNLVIDNADRQVAAAPVTGHVDYQSSLPLIEGVSIRMSFDLPGGATISHYDHPMGPLPSRGTLRFQLTPLKNAMNERSRELPGTLPVFCNLCRQSPEGRAPDVLLSNTCATLIDVI